MLRLLILGLVPALAASAAVGQIAGGRVSGQPIVRETANGEFLSRHYPRGAYKRGEQGKVAFRLTVERDGSPASCEVTQSSGFKLLDDETCELLLNHARVQPARSSDGRAIRSVRSGFIVWKLPEGTHLASATTRQTGKPDPIVCKRFQAPGSLIVKNRTCMTRSEWTRQEQFLKTTIEGIRDRNFCGDHGCY